MPSDDYTPVVRGGLKLKGAPTGVTKKKKKKTKTSSSDPKALEVALKDHDEKNRTEEQDGAATKEKKTTVEGGDEGTEVDGQDMRELEHRDPNDGKTASERAYEETRRKRVCYCLLLSLFPLNSSIYLCLHPNL